MKQVVDELEDIRERGGETRRLRDEVKSHMQTIEELTKTVEDLKKRVQDLQQQLEYAGKEVQAAQMEATDYSKALIRVCKLINV